MKNFDAWNEVKKITNESEISNEFFFHEGEIWWCTVGINIGVESDGKDDTFERPVLIVRVFNKNMVWVVPITSTVKDSPFYYEFTFKDRTQSLMLTQLKTISTKRLKRYLGVLPEGDLGMVIQKIASLLKTKPLPKERNLGTREGTNE